MHMISNQAQAVTNNQNFLNEKAGKVNLLKRKSDNANDENEEFKQNKHLKTSASSFLSPSSTSSTLSLAIGELNNGANKNNCNRNEEINHNQCPSLDSSNLVNNKHGFEFIIKNHNKPVSDECKENHYNNTKPSTSLYDNNETVPLHVGQYPSQLPYSQPTTAFINKPSSIDVQNFMTGSLINHANMTVEHKLTDPNQDFPQNKYKKFLSNFNQQKKFVPAESFNDEKSSNTQERTKNNFSQHFNSAHKDFEEIKYNLFFFILF